LTYSLCTVAMAFGFSFKELPALHGVMTLGILSGKCSRFRSMAISLSGDPK